MKDFSRRKPKFFIFKDLFSIFWRTFEGLCKPCIPRRFCTPTLKHNQNILVRTSHYNQKLITLCFLAGNTLLKIKRYRTEKFDSQVQNIWKLWVMASWQYPYPFNGVFFSWNPAPTPWKFQLSFINNFFLKIVAFELLFPYWIYGVHGYLYFLELHIMGFQKQRGSLKIPKL